MKIKDTPIADKLPKLKAQFLSVDGVERQLMYCKGRYSMHEKVLNTDIDLNEIAEVDVEKGQKALMKAFDLAPLDKYQWKMIVIELAKAGVIKWKEQK